MVGKLTRRKLLSGAALALVLSHSAIAGWPGTGKFPGILALPPGALGTWHIDQYTTSPRIGIPNAAVGGSLSANLVNVPFGFMQTDQYGGSASYTDNYANGPQGSMNATRVQVSSGGQAFVNLGLFPAGTYTWAADIKQTSGATGSFIFVDINNNLSSVFTPTSSYQTFKFTTTLSSPISNGTFWFVYANQSAAVDVLVCNVRIFAGSSDLGFNTPVGHLNLGVSGLDSTFAGSYSGGILDMHSDGCGVVQFGSATTLSTFTVTCYAKKVVAGNDTGGLLFANLVSGNNSNGYRTFACALNANGNVFSSNPVFIPGPVLANTTLGNPGPFLADLNGDGFHFYAFVYDGTYLTMWFDNLPLCFAYKPGLTAQSVTAMLFCNVNNIPTTGSPFPCSFAFAGTIAYWASNLTAAQIQQARAYTLNRAQTHGVTIPSVPTRFWVAVGDSITEIGEGNISTYPAITNLNSDLTTKTYVANDAYEGTTIANWVTYAPAVDAILDNALPGQEIILSFLIGANDGGAITSNPTGYWTGSLLPWWQARVAAGWTKTVGCTNTGENSSSWNTEAAVLAGLIRGAVVGSGPPTNTDPLVAVIDFGANADVGFAGDGQPPYFNGDGVHPTQTGENVMATVAYPVINAL